MRTFTDRAIKTALYAAAGLAALVILLVALFTLKETLPVFGNVSPHHFLTDELWSPSSGQFGMTPMIAGTVAVALGAAAVAVPLGVSCGLFISLYAPGPLARVFRTILELFAAVPSVIFGLIGLVVLVPMISRIEPPGASLLAGIAVLSLMVLPTMALAAADAIAAVPKSYVEGARALAISRWSIVRTLVLPTARRGLLSGMILTAGRAVGETMAVMMVVGNVIKMPSSLFQPVRTLTANIALEMAYAMGDHRSALFVSGLFLLAVIALLVLAAESVSKGAQHA
jgi:phosphate transport system permease protein